MSYFKIISQKEHLGTDGVSATMEIIVDWPSRLTQQRGFYGRMQGGVYFSPTQYADIAGLFCTSVDCEPFGAPNAAGNGWDYAKLTVQFGQMETPAGTNVGEVRITVGGNTINLPKRAYIWAEGDKENTLLDQTSDINPFMISPEINLSVSLNFQTSFNPLSFASYVGKVNNGTFFAGGLGYAPETVLYTGSDSSRELSSDGSKYYKVTHNFSIKEEGTTWNKFWDGDQWSKITTLSGDEVYEQADLNAVIVVV